MSSTDEPAAEHAYFRAIEDRFIELRGSPLLLSPADWQLARQWHEAGIPLQLVLDVLEQVFAGRKARAVRGKVQGLRYCAPAVEAAWASLTELQQTGVRRTAEAVDVAARLESLKEGLQECQLEVSGFLEELDALGGAPDEVEKQLADLDRRLIELATAEIGPSDRAEIDASVSRSLSRIRNRLGEEDLEGIREHLFHQAVRRRFRLPTLSLFGESS